MGNNLPKQKKLIPISGAAKILGVSIDTVRRWDKSGVLHSERSDGKNRYFSLNELEKYKSCQPLSISEASLTLGISTTTLRRLEERGLIKPERNGAGERVYDKELLKNFLKSDYSLRKKPIEKKIIEPLKKEVKKAVQLNLQPWQRVPELLAATVTFCLLLAIGVTNIQAQVVQSPLSFVFSPNTTAPAVLSQTIQATPEATPVPTIEPKLSPSPIATPEAELNIPPIATDEADLTDETARGNTAETESEPMKIVTVILEDKSSVANIRKKASTASRIIGQAENGSSYELISKTTDWYEVKLVDGLTGFISAKYIWKDEEDN